MLETVLSHLKYNLRDKLDISEGIDILTSEDMENTLLVSPVPELSFLPAPHIGAEPGRAKGESRITCMRMLRMNQSKISRPQPSAQTIRVCARNALFCQISNMAEDCCDASGFSAVYLFIVLSAFAHLFYTKMLYLESLRVLR